MLREYLEAEGVVVLMPGQEHAALLGSAGGMLNVPLKVRRSDLERAQELLVAWDQGEAVAVSEMDADELIDWADAQGPADEVSGGGPYRGGPSIPESTSRRRMKAAFASLFITFGMGHIAVGKPRWGLAFLCAELLGLASVWGIAPGGLQWLIVTAMAGDFLGSQRAIGKDASES